MKLKQNEMESLIKPKQIDYLKNKNLSKSLEKPNYKIKNKPLVDYKIKIRNLENEIMLTNQKYNDVKKKNIENTFELNELRKNVNIHRQKLNFQTKELTKDENEFISLKESIEKNINNKHEDNTFKIIFKDQKELFSKNNVMIQKIKDADKDTTSKLAAKKYLEHEKKKLIEQEKKSVSKWNKELKTFYDDNSTIINKIQNFDPSSKVIEILDLEKIKEYEDILQKIYSHTNLEDIDSLVKYFIDCSKEVNYYLNNILIKSLEI